jgi:predicted MPP superfamily phosphohydrolase
MRSPYILVPLLIMFLIYTTYKVHRIFRRRKSVSLLIVAIALTFSVASQFLYRSLATNHNPYANSFAINALMWVGGFILGLLATFWLFALIFDVVGLFHWLFERFRQTSESPTNPERRLFLGRSFSTAVLAGSAGMATVGLGEVLVGPRVKEVTIEFPMLHPSLEGLRIAQISDLHVGPTIRKNYVMDVVAAVMSTKPDLIAVTGDLADGKPDQLRDDLQPLSGLQAPQGVFYVTGNHEYYWGVDSWVEKARELGFRPLLNENVILQVSRPAESSSAKLMIAGVTDTNADQFDPAHASDPAKAIQSPEACDLKILLAHRPDSCFEAANAGFHFQMSGHTHAGQFFPFSILVSFAHKYFRGLYKHEGMWLYVNSGTGYWGPPNRFTVPPEITLFRLKKKT